MSATTAPRDRRRSPLATLLLAVVNLYRWTASVRTPRCRFVPTCSTYAADAITEHGALRGAGLTIRRISRCHPFDPGGHDPVPLRK